LQAARGGNPLLRLRYARLPARYESQSRPQGLREVVIQPPHAWIGGATRAG